MNERKPPNGSRTVYTQKPSGTVSRNQGGPSRSTEGNREGMQPHALGSQQRSLDSTQRTSGSNRMDSPAPRTNGPRRDDAPSSARSYGYGNDRSARPGSSAPPRPSASGYSNSWNPRQGGTAGGQAPRTQWDAPKRNDSTPHSRIRESVDVDQVNDLWRTCFTDKVQESLSQLTALAKDSRVKTLLNEKQDRATLRGLLSAEQPKVRKNAARLLGALALPGDVPALIEALKTEETKFVAPSLLLALGNCSGDDALAAVRAFVQSLPEADELDGKHIREAKEAATIALSRLSPRMTRNFVGLPNPMAIELIASEGCIELLADEAKKAGFAATKSEGDSLFFTTKDYSSLFALRSFTEALIPVSTCALPPLDGRKTDIEAWGKVVAAAAKPFAQLLGACLSGEPPFQYRIELRGVLHGERGPLAHSVAVALDESGETLNSPSAYDAELRLSVSGRNTKISAKLYTPPDLRFDYRKGSLPASINPVTAATLLRFAHPYLKAQARVVDPCCGSATLLIERAKLLPAAELVGVDISPDAVSIARTNVKAANAKVEIIGGDMLKFRPRAPFNELIANLPFGTRVGTHDANAELYKGLVERLDDLLAPDGIAILYTTQRAPLLRLATDHGYGVIAEKRLEAGGLNPWVVILKKR